MRDTSKKIYLELIEKILNEKNKKMRESAPIKKILNQIIRHYAEITSSNTLVYSNKRKYKENFQFSMEAQKIEEQAKQEVNKEKQEKLYKQLHFEHIVPCKTIYNELINLKDVSTISIEKIMTKMEIIIISKEQQKKLDKQYKDKGTKEERLRYLGIYDEFYK